MIQSCGELFNFRTHRLYFRTFLTGRSRTIQTQTLSTTQCYEPKKPHQMDGMLVLMFQVVTTRLRFG